MTKSAELYLLPKFLLSAEFPRIRGRVAALLLDLIMCKKDGEFYQFGCIKQTCKKCGPEKIKELVGENVRDIDILVKEWKLKKVTIGGAQKTKKVLEEEFMKVTELVERLIKDLGTYPMHYFNAKWQGVPH